MNSLEVSASDPSFLDQYGKYLNLSTLFFFEIESLDVFL